MGITLEKLKFSPETQDILKRTKLDAMGESFLVDLELAIEASEHCLARTVDIFYSAGLKQCVIGAGLVREIAKTIATGEYFDVTEEMTELGAEAERKIRENLKKCGLR